MNELRLGIVRERVRRFDKVSVSANPCRKGLFSKEVERVKMDSRKEFEAWAGSFGSVFPLEKDRSGDYLSVLTGNIWAMLRNRLAGLEAELDQEQSAHLVTIDDRDSAQDALQATHIALGGDGEWVTRMPEPDPPESGDLCKDVPVIAAQIFGEAKAAQERAETLQSELFQARASVGFLSDSILSAESELTRFRSQLEVNVAAYERLAQACANDIKAEHKRAETAEADNKGLREALKFVLGYWCHHQKECVECGEETGDGPNTCTTCYVVEKASQALHSSSSPHEVKK